MREWNRPPSVKEELAVAVRHEMQKLGQDVSKAVLVTAVENALGRRLTPMEASVAIWNAREAFLHENGVEIRSIRGKLSVASAEQSISRRQKERSRALRTLERSAERASILAASDGISDSARKALNAAAEKANTMLVHAIAAAGKKRNLPGVD